MPTTTSPAILNVRAAIPGNDTIVFNVPGTITFALAGSGENGGETGDLDITDSLTIIGHPDGTTIDAADLDRIFDINPAGAPGIVVTLRNIHITNGTGPGGAGAIQLRGATLILENCTISNSVATVNDAGANLHVGQRDAEHDQHHRDRQFRSHPCRRDPCRKRRCQHHQQHDHKQQHRPRIPKPDWRNKKHWNREPPQHDCGRQQSRRLSPEPGRNIQQPWLQHHRRLRRQPAAQSNDHSSAGHGRSDQCQRRPGKSRSTAKQRWANADARASSRQHRHRQRTQQRLINGPARPDASMRRRRDHRMRLVATAETWAHLKCRSCASSVLRQMRLTMWPW